MDFLWNILLYLILPLASFIAFLLFFHYSGLLYLLIGAYYCSHHPPPAFPSPRTEPSSKKAPAPGSRRRKGLRALVLGGSGGVGRNILAALDASPEYERVTLLIRSTSRIPRNLSSKCQVVTIDFDNLENVVIGGEHDIGFYSLGVYAGFVSEEDYIKLEYVKALALGALFKRCGVKDVHWVTAIGTAPNSPFLFGKTKFKVEQSVGALGFERVVFYRPGGVLTSDGSGQFGKERIGLMRWLDWFRWLTVDGAEMGQVVVHNSIHGGGGRKKDIFKNGHINQYARAMTKL